MSTHQVGTNTGHGHVWPRPDGLKARCGGTMLCKECKEDAKLSQGIPTMHQFVILESPFRSTTKQEDEANHAYLLECMRDSLWRGEAPFASHMLYTQCLDDNVPLERELGIEAGLYIGQRADKTVVYIDRGISPGMQKGIERAIFEGRPVEYRQIRSTH